MFARLFVIGTLTLLPTFALADTTDQSSASASSALTPQGNGALLGPASSADSSSLQGASTSPLQSSTGSSNGLTAPVGDPLQAGATSEDLKVLISGESDGAPITMTDESTLSDVPGLMLSGLLILGIIGFIVFSRRREIRR